MRSTFAVGLALFVGLYFIDWSPASSQDKSLVPVTITGEESSNISAVDLLNILADVLEEYNISVHQVDNTDHDPIILALDIDSSDKGVVLATGLMNRSGYSHNLPSEALSPTYQQPVVFPLSQISESSTLTYLTALTLYINGRCNEALASLNELQSPVNLTNDLVRSIAFYRGNCAILNSDLVNALSSYKIATGMVQAKTGTIAVEATINYAWVLFQAGYSRMAAQWIDNIDTALLTEAYHINRAHLYALMSRPDDAIHDINQMIDHAESLALSEFAVAALYLRRGQYRLMLYEWDRVLDDYNTALALAPDFVDAYYFRGVLYYSIMPGGLVRAEALEDFEQYLVLNPGGTYAEQARAYIHSIRLELEALND